MKKSILFILIGLLVLSGCQKKTNTGIGGCSIDESVDCSNDEENPSIGTVGMVNPNVSYDSLEEINELIGVNLIKPPVMGISDETFIVINNEIGEYTFKINGQEYTLRASKKTDDISGIYGKDGLIFNNEVCENYETHFEDNIKAGRFFYDGTQYVLSVLDNNEISEENFKDILFEIGNIVSSNTIENN